MSNIGAILHFDDRPVDPADIERMARTLNRPAIDKVETFVRGPIGFVHCLQRFTPEDRFERQPVAIDDRFWLVWDGRIDNRDELANELGIGTTDRAELADSVMFAKAYRRWEDKAPERLVGDFAVIVYDRKKRELRLIRDHLGRRPLFHHRADWGVAVATEVRGLHALPSVPRELDEEAVAHFLARLPYRNTATHFARVDAVAPSAVITLGGGGQRSRTYWDIESIENVRFPEPDDYVDRLRELLNLVVRLQMRSTVGLASTLTGGLDAASIATTAARHLEGTESKLPTYTAVPGPEFARDDTDGRIFDERPYVEAIAAHCPRIDARFVEPDNRSLLERLDELAPLYDTPITNFFNALWHNDILRHAKRNGNRVLLNGEVGNSVMSHAGWDRLPRSILKGRFLEFLREFRAVPAKHRRFIWRNYVLQPLIPKALFRRYKRLKYGNRHIGISWTKLNASLVERHSLDQVALNSDWSPIEQFSIEGRKSRMTYIMDFEGTSQNFAADRAEFGIDNRSPALDRRLVEYCLGIPNDLWLRAGVSRWPLRRAMRGQLPEIVRTSIKTGIQAADWASRLQSQAEPVIEAMARINESPFARTFLDTESLAKASKSLPKCDLPDLEKNEWLFRSAIPHSIGLSKFQNRLYRRND